MRKSPTTPKALLLCAGLGTRLRPLTSIVPKSLVPVHGVPLLAYWIDILCQAGVRDILINTCHLKDDFIRFLDLVDWPLNIELAHESKLLGTAGTLKKNAEFLKGGDFFLVHADNYSVFNGKEFLDAHHVRHKNSLMTMMTFDTSRPETCGVIELDDEGMLVTGFYEKSQSPPTCLASGAVFLCSPELLEIVRGWPGTPEDFSAEIIPKLTGKFGHYKNNIVHKDIGSWYGLREALQSQMQTFNNSKIKISAVLAWEKVFSRYSENIKASMGRRFNLDVIVKVGENFNPCEYLNSNSRVAWPLMRGDGL